MMFARSENHYREPSTVSETPITTAADLGATVRTRRKEAGLTLAEAARRCGVGIRFLSELENGKPTVRLDKVLQVVEALDLALHLAAAEAESAAKEAGGYDLDDLAADVKSLLGVDEAEDR